MIDRMDELRSCGMEMKHAYRCWHRLLQSMINPTLRKCGSSYEQGVANIFEKKGVILTSLKPGASLDDAESDGIEVPENS